MDIEGVLKNYYSLFNSGQHKRAATYLYHNPVIQGFIAERREAMKISNSRSTSQDNSQNLVELLTRKGVQESNAKLMISSRDFPKIGVKRALLVYDYLISLNIPDTSAAVLSSIRHPLRNTEGLELISKKYHLISSFYGDLSERDLRPGAKSYLKKFNMPLNPSQSHFAVLSLISLEEAMSEIRESEDLE